MAMLNNQMVNPKPETMPNFGLVLGIPLALGWKNDCLWGLVTGLVDCWVYLILNHHEYVCFLVSLFHIMYSIASSLTSFPAVSLEDVFSTHKPQLIVFQNQAINRRGTLMCRQTHFKTTR